MNAEETNTKEFADTKIITSYLVRCTTEQKEFLQKTIAESGQAAAQFLVEAASSASQKNNENIFLDDDLTEVDSLIGRLSRLMKAKIYITCEKEKQVSNELKIHEMQKLQWETQLQNTRNETELELNERRRNLELEYSDKETQWQKNLQEEKSEWEKQVNTLKEEINSLQTKFSQKTQESTIREKQYADSVKLHQNIEERSLELKKQNDEFKKEILELKKFKDDTPYLEKERDELKAKIELINAIHEQELKNLHGEYSLRAQILTHEVEKRFLTPVL